MALRTRAHVRGASHHGHEIGLRPLAEVGNLFRGADARTPRTRGHRGHRGHRGLNSPNQFTRMIA